MEKVETYGASGFTHEDYRAAIAEWKLRLVGSPEINDMQNPEIAEKIKALDKLCLAKWQSMNKGEKPEILWGDSKPIESGELSKQFGGILTLARGWGTYGSEFYQNEQLLRDIKFGLEWMYENMYGEAEKRNEGWRDIYACNWWYWFIGAPEYFTDTYIIIEEHLTKDDIRRYSSLYEWLRQDPKSKIKSTTANIEAKLGILLEDVEKLRFSNTAVHNSMEVTEYGKVRKDFTHWWHAFPHNMTYGVVQNLSRPLFVSSILAPTALRFVSERKYNQFLMLKYMFEPAIYHGRGFFMLSGRQTAGAEYEKGGEALALMLPMIGVYGEEEDFYIKRLIKSHAKDERVLAHMKKVSPLYDLAQLFSILNDDSIPDDCDYEYAHAWYTGDRATQHRKDYAIGISMNSSREIAYESILGLNTRAWYTSDGAVYLYTDYDKNAHDGANFITKNIDIAYRIPGTTEDERERVARSINSGQAWSSPSDYAGSMQIEDKYLLAAMHYRSMSYDGPDDVVDTGYGGGLAPHDNDLVAKKSYFCFDKEIICLGAGITSTMNSPVNTIVEHKRIIDDALYSQYADGKALPKAEFTKEYEGADSFLMEGHAGFCILDGKKTLAKRYIGESGQSFIEYRICHGENPTGATYAYAILPYASADALGEYVKNPEALILSNTERVQAVKKPSLGISSFAFYEAAECDGISVSAPALLTRTERDGGLSIRVADPTHKLCELEIKLAGEYKPSEAHKRISVHEEKGETLIRVDLTESYGEAYEVKF